jgi:hypothetical protein
MLITIEEDKKEVFEPVKITLTIQSKSELIELWYRMFLSVDCINDNSDEDFGRGVPCFDTGLSDVFWDGINMICCKKGYRKVND